MNNNLRKIACLIIGCVLAISAIMITEPNYADGQPYETGLTASVTLRPTRTPRPTITASLTPTVTPTLVRTIAINTSNQSAGTALPQIDTAFGESGLTAIQQVARWGYGPVYQVQYSKDGKTFYAAGPYGLMTYDYIKKTKIWFSFEYGLDFDQMLINNEENLFCFISSYELKNNPQKNTCYDLIARRFTENVNQPAINSNAFSGESPLPLTSPNGRYTVSTKYWIPENITLERPSYLNLVISFPQSDRPEINIDAGIYIQYDERGEPEGCDLDYFSPCGNAFEAEMLTPNKISFSANSAYIGMLQQGFANYQFSIFQIFNSDNGSLIFTAGDKQNPVTDFNFSPDGKFVLISYLSGVIKIFNIQSSEQIFHAWDFNAPLLGGTLTANGIILLIRDQSGYIRLLRASDGQLINRYQAESAALSPADGLLALGYDDGKVQIINIDNGKTLQTIQAHDQKVYDLVFSVDGQILVSSSQDCTVKSWGVRSGNFLHFFETVRVNPYQEEWSESRIFVHYMAAIPNSKQLIGFGSWGTAVSWDINSGKTQYIVTSQPLEYFNGMKTLAPHFPSSFWIIPGENHFFINEFQYALDNGAAEGTFTAPETYIDGCSSATATTPDGKLSFAAGYDRFEGEICVIDSATGTMQARIVPPKDVGNPYQNYDPQFVLSPDGQVLFIINYGGVVDVYQNPK
ncbi:MAG TPA: WD40 repeat domain-containing protein [Bellilinea sp.]|nr:WD40 repeat domain-containing protein [Bellilinea sp.]